MISYYYVEVEGHSVIRYTSVQPSELDGISRAIARLTRQDKAEVKRKQQIHSGRHARRAWRTIRQRGTMRETEARSTAKTKLPKLRSQRPSSFSRYGGLTRRTEYINARFRSDSPSVTRHTWAEQRKLKGPKVEVYDPEW